MKDADNAVSIETASIHACATLVEHAVHELPSMIADAEPDIPWLECLLGDPVTLYDIRAEPLAHAFPVVDVARRTRGRILVAADRRLGSTLLSIERHATEWPLPRAMRRACDLAVERYPGWTLRGVMPIVRDLPEPGVMAIAEHPRSGRRERVALDMHRGVEVPIVDATTPPAEELRLPGYPAWSPLDLPAGHDFTPAIERWEADDAWARDLWTRLSEEGDGHLLADLSRRQLQHAFDPSLLARLVRADVDCEVHVAQVRAHFTMSTVGFCTVAVARTIASRYGVHDSEADVASVMGIPHPNPQGSADWATAEEELRYYRDDLGKRGSKVYSDCAYLSDPVNYRDEIAEAEHGKGPCNLRKWGVGSFHHSRALCGVRICQTPSGKKVQLGLLHVDDPTSAHVPPQYWEVFDATPLTSGGVVSTNLEIGGLVVVRD